MTPDEVGGCTRWALCSLCGFVWAGEAWADCRWCRDNNEISSTLTHLSDEDDAAVEVIWELYGMDYHFADYAEPIAQRIRADAVD